MQISITELRSDIYKYFQYIQSTREPLIVSTKTGLFSISFRHEKISLDSFSSGLDLIVGDPEDLVYAHLNLEWKEKENLL